jgi:hypothetical protein
VRISGLEISSFINSPLAIGLQSGWESFALLACIPPFILVLLFKVYIERTFARSFKYYVPTESELRDSGEPKSPQGSLWPSRTVRGTPYAFAVSQYDAAPS